MKIKAGHIPAGKNEEEWHDATWDYPGVPYTIDILDEEGCLVLRIDPEDFMAIAAAIAEKIVRQSDIPQYPDADLN